MSPITHLLTGWLVAESGGLTGRDRAMVTVAGIIPDLDGAGLIAEVLTRHSDHPLRWWSDYHHVFGHNLTFGLATMAAALLLAQRRGRTAWLALAAFHLHLLGDLVGARGPDGDSWPIPYLWPFAHTVSLAWSGQWALNAWPNMVLTALMLAATLYLAWKRGASPLGLIWPAGDRVLVDTLRRRFPRV